MKYRVESINYYGEPMLEEVRTMHEAKRLATLWYDSGHTNITLVGPRGARYYVRMSNAKVFGDSHNNQRLIFPKIGQ